MQVDKFLLVKRDSTTGQVGFRCPKFQSNNVEMMQRLAPKRCFYLQILSEYEVKKSEAEAKPQPVPQDTQVHAFNLKTL